MSKVAEYYDAKASTYHEQYIRDNLRKLPEYPANYFRLQLLMQRLTQLSLRSVYEVGVGEGTPLASMASAGLRVAGCDITHGMVTVARETFTRRGLSPDLIQWGDIEDSTTFAGQLKDGQFDAVVAAGVLPHVRNDRLALGNVGMIVRPGGRVFIEFRNKLFSLFTFNRYTKEFFLNDLLGGMSPKIRDAVAKYIDQRVALEQPPVRSTTTGGAPGYDAILSKFHNPFELVEFFRANGYSDPQIHWYHYHPAPPVLEKELGSEFREGAIALEHEASWRGWFLCSAGVVEAVRT